MNNSQIDDFVTDKKRKNKLVNVHFKTRPTIKGMFVFLNDYPEMKEKNFWRIVGEQKMEEWLEKKDHSSSRLFSGSEFTRLSDL